MSLWFILASNTFPQTLRADFNRPQTFDTLHYAIKTKFDRASKKITGETTVTLKPLKPNFRIVELDAVGLSFTSVKLGSGLDLRFTAGKDKATIQLDRVYSPEETITLDLKYTALPKKGVYFVAAQTNPERVRHSSQIWTQGQPDEARHWFPSFDFPSDKATSEQYLTANKGETVIANGDLIAKNENPDGTVTWHYRMSEPHSTYLVSFVIGEYVRTQDKYRAIPLAAYVYPGTEHIVDRAFGATKRMMGVFEELTGVAYPFNKYDQTIVAEFTSGGMENITATTYADQYIFLVGTPLGDGVVTDIVAHELAHSWFGNLVTCRNWAELWLNEGFATFMESVYIEKRSGRKAYLTKIQTDAEEFLINDSVNNKKHGLFNHRAAKVNELFDNSAVTYYKGGAVLHTLREQVGDAAFWRAVNTYLVRHKFDSVESTDLQKAMEEASGQDLAWFFDQWVYRAGAPNLDIKQTYNDAAKTFTLTINQTQKADALTPAAFRLPLEITLETPNGVVNRNFEIKKRSETFTLEVEARPTRVVVDPNEKVPVKRVKLREMVSQ